MVGWVASLIKQSVPIVRAFVALETKHRGTWGHLKYGQGTLVRLLIAEYINKEHACNLHCRFMTPICWTSLPEDWNYVDRSPNIRYLNDCTRSKTTALKNAADFNQPNIFIRNGLQRSISTLLGGDGGEQLDENKDG